MGQELFDRGLLGGGDFVPLRLVGRWRVPDFVRNLYLFREKIFSMIGQRALASKVAVFRAYGRNKCYLWLP